MISPPIGPWCRPFRAFLGSEDVSPATILRALHDEPRAFALSGRWAGGSELVGSDPIEVAAPHEDPFAALAAVPQMDRSDYAASGFVGGGWFGYLGYGLGSMVEDLDPSPPNPARVLPLFDLAFYDHLLRNVPGEGWWFEALITERTEDRIHALRDSWEARFAQELSRVPDPLPIHNDAGRLAPGGRFSVRGPWQSTPSAAGHARAVEACRERIRAGDLFQANICQRLESEYDGDPVEAFFGGVDALHPDRAAYLTGPNGSIASLSPELFLERKGAEVRTAPIKGTRPRPDDPEQAERLRAELGSSEKDVAENRMILDMARNDLGRVCDYGSVVVGAIAEVRPHAGVWHLVSEVTGRLHASQGDRELLRATFPPASVTGAPKIAAENVIAELESTPREVYTGAIGFASPAAGLELSVAIRTFEFTGERVWLGVGGGIVADSDPNEESAECLTKASPLLRAIGVNDRVEAPKAVPNADARSRSQRIDSPAEPAEAWPVPMRLSPRPVPRPDPGRGIIETVRVEDGAILDFELHLERARRSAWALYGLDLPAELERDLNEATNEIEGRWRLRIDLVPVGREIRNELHLTRLPDRSAAPYVRLAAVCVPGGVGPHKWLDRRLIEALEAAVTPALPVICDLDGYVLEASRSNVFLQTRGEAALQTPPADGRILPGVTRAKALNEPESVTEQWRGLEASEAATHITELAGAERVWTTNSVRGVEAALLDDSLRSGTESGAGAPIKRSG